MPLILTLGFSLKQDETNHLFWTNENLEVHHCHLLQWSRKGHVGTLDRDVQLPTKDGKVDLLCAPDPAPFLTLSFASLNGAGLVEWGQ